MRFLFVKNGLCFPRTSGHDVHTYWMMRSLFEAGHEISLLTVVPCKNPAIEGIELKALRQFSVSDGTTVNDLRLSKLQSRFCSYWGTPASRIQQVADMAHEMQIDVVVASGLDVLPYLAAVKQAKRIWYAADEWVVHHLSQFSLTRPASWSNLKLAVIKGLYERAFASKVDRVWLVSERDAKWIRRVMPGVKTDVVPNGVDTGYYSHRKVSEIDRSCVFWGRLDFGPNLDAIRWFGRNVWREMPGQFPDAKFSVFGFKPGPEIRQMAEEFGFQLTTDQADIRNEICAHQLVVLPFVSGAGIKNKLLEAASMSRPIVASSKALNGVDTGSWKPVYAASNKRTWINALTELWADSARRCQLGQDARSWVSSEYTWESAANRVISAMEC